MKIGVVFPQTEIGNNPAAIKDYAQTVEELGYTHILAYDHVLGANPERLDRLNGPYTDKHPFHEVFVLFSFLAAVTEKLELVTGILILPQRQTALVAKQAAALDVLSGGRLRLGVGIGWNHVEYDALGQNFHNRGARSEEQVTLLRQLWTQPLVTFKGRWHNIADAGINPLPVQRPIPIWFGGKARPVMRRIARLGDGWMPSTPTVEGAKESLEWLEDYLSEEGRERSGFGLEPRLNHGDGDPHKWAEVMQGWQEVGATHLSFNTMGCGFDTPRKHLDALERFAREVGIS
jgi:probable F420-dependent oxidoreductase